MSVDLTTTVTLNGQSVTATVYEDTDNDGTAENQESVSVADGTDTYTLSTLTGTGDQYWIGWSLGGGTHTETATVTSATITTATEVTGTVTLDGSAVEGATVTGINDDTGVVGDTATTASDGTYTLMMASGATVHVIVQYDDGAGSQYRAESNPFVTT